MSSLLQGLRSQHTNPASSTRMASLPGKPLQVVAYLRVSHDLQANNHTFETQESRIREKLDRRYGTDNYDLTIYKDDGLSGGFGPVPSGIQPRTRPTLKKLGQEILEGRYQCLAVYSSSRLFRSARWLLQWMEDVILPSGIEFISATEDFDITSSHGRIMFSFLGIINTAYREDCQQRNRDAAAARSEDGYTPGGAPYGWRQEPRIEDGKQRRGIIPDAEARPHLLLMRDRYLAGNSCEKIAAELNGRGIPTCKGVQWNATQILRILKNPIHAGFAVTKRFGLIKGRHFEDRYWEPEVYQQIIDLCERRRTCWKTNTAKAGTPHLVNGIAFCARCGKRLYVTAGSYRGYICRNGRQQGVATCPDVTARADMLEGAVVQEICRVAKDPLMRQLLQKEAERVCAQEEESLQKEHIQLTRTLESLQDQTNRLLDRLERDIITESEFASRNRLPRAKCSEVQQRLVDVESSLANRAKREVWAAQVQKVALDFPLLWEQATFDEQRQLLFALVESLVVDRQGRDAVVRLKIHLLPERELRISFDHTRHIKVKPKGVAALTPRHLAVLHYVGQGKRPKEIARALGTGIDCIYQFSMNIRRTLGVRTLQEAYLIAQPRIEQQLAFLPLGSDGRRRLRRRKITDMPNSLKEVLPLLAQGATSREIARRTGLTADTVLGRRKRILEIFDAKTIFEATERAKAMGLLPD